MKKLFILTAFMAIAICCFAQMPDRPANTKPVTVGSGTIKNISITGPDLSVIITNIAYNAGNYTISYTLKNNGNVRVDLKDVTMQGHIYDASGRYISPGGGVALLYSGVLNAGQEYKGTLGCTDKDVYKNWNYKYVLNADDKNAVAETNENNNSAEYPITGYKDAMANVNVNTDRPQKGKVTAPPVQTPPNTPPPPPPPAKLLPDLVITGASISKKPDNTFEVQYTMKNTGAGDVEININGIRSNGRILKDGFSMCNTYHFSTFPRKVLKPGETHINIYTIAPNLINTLTSGQQYEYWITIDYIKDIRESNENNNDFKINFRPIF